MGNICFRSKEEKKGSALDETETLLSDQHYHSSQNQNQDDAHQAIAPPPNNGMLLSNNTPPLSAADQQKENERLKALRAEQARLEIIVQATGRSMVPVRSARGSNSYYDQGFGAALAQHLEQTTMFPDRLATILPSSSTTDTVLTRLSQPMWDNVHLGTKGTGVAGCAGENPHSYLEHLAESYLETVVPKKERLFSGAQPIVENLL